MSVDAFAVAKPRPESGPCRCRNGLLGNVRTDGPGPLYLLFVYQAKAKTIQFCDCESGRNMRSFLLGRLRKIQSGDDYVPPGMDNALQQWIQQGQEDEQTTNA